MKYFTHSLRRLTGGFAVKLATTAAATVLLAQDNPTGGDTPAPPPQSAPTNTPAAPPAPVPSPPATASAEILDTNAPVAPAPATIPALPVPTARPASTNAGNPTVRTTPAVVPAFPPPPTAVRTPAPSAAPGTTAAPGRVPTLPVPGTTPAPAAPAGATNPLPSSPPTGTVAKAENMLLLKNADLDVVFDEYMRRTGRTVLYASNLKVQVSITTSPTANLTDQDIVNAIEGALALNGVSLIPLGDKFVKAVLNQNSGGEGSRLSFTEANQLPDAEQYITHVVQLKVALPSEVAQLLASFAKTPQGIVPIDSSQIIVIRDYASNVKRMLQLIEKVDVEPTSEYKLEVIPIKYGRVTDIFDTMNALISGSGGGGAAGSAASRTGVTGGRRGGTGMMTPTSFGGGAGRLGSSSSSRSGSSRYGGAYGQGQFGQQQLGGIQAGQPGAVGGAPGTAGGSTFQQRLNQIINRAAGDSGTQVLGDARIVPDERSNSLIVFANRQDMQMITNIVDKVDVLLAQVLIEGIVVAVALGDSQELGVSWAQNPRRFGQDFSGVGAINNGFFGVLTNFPSATPGGFSYWGRIGDDLSVAVTAMATDSRVRVLQRPRIQTSHAVPGFFFSGSTVPYVTGFYDYGYYGGSGVSSRSTVEQIQVGVSLQVTPYITPDGLVVLDIFQDISQLGEYVKIDNNEVPTTTSRSAQATLSVRDSETIMLGGYIEDNRSSGKSGVPVLKDIPGLGLLFRASKDKNSRAELILLMKVTVLKNPKDASSLAEIERARLPTLNKAQREFNKLERPTTTPAASEQ